MNDIYIFHHVGMGDAILCNGLVRHYTELYDRVFVFMQRSNIRSMIYMYRDNPRIKIIEGHDDFAKQFMQINPQNKYLVIGHTPAYFNGLNHGDYKFDEGFYKMANVPVEFKWSKFYVKRDLEKEEETFNLAGIEKDEPYIFVHDDPSRNRVFRPNLLPTNIKRIRPVELKDINLFGFLSIIENAREVHIHNSSFANIIDTMLLKSDNVFYHNYARTDCGNQLFHQQLKWHIID